MQGPSLPLSLGYCFRKPLVDLLWIKKGAPFLDSSWVLLFLMNKQKAGAGWRAAELSFLLSASALTVGWNQPRNCTLLED